MKTKKESKILLLTHFSKYLIVFAAFLFLISYGEKTKVAQKLIPARNYYQTPKTTVTAQNIKVFAPSPAPAPPPFSWTVEKVDEHETKMTIPADPRMSTSEELFSEMNNYRQSHSLSTIQKSDKLCEIAQKRADEQVANGGLDNHAGFDKYAKDQQEFSRIGEVLFGGGQPEYAVHIVEFGWDRSLTGHREAIQDPNWQYGCGGIAGYYAVFIFGTH